MFRPSNRRERQHGREVSARPLIVLITDGEGVGAIDTNDVTNGSAGDTRVDFHIIGVSSDAAVLARLEALAASTGGTLHAVQSAQDVPAAVEAVGSRLRGNRTGIVGDSGLVAAQHEQSQQQITQQDPQLEHLTKALREARDQNARLTQQNRILERDLHERIDEIQGLNRQTDALKNKVLEQDAGLVRFKHASDECEKTVEQLKSVNDHLVQAQKELVAEYQKAVEKLNATQANLDQSSCARQATERQARRM